MESTFTINRVDGELMLKSIECQINADMVSGQVMAKSIGPLSITKVASNLNARNVEGSLECELVTGNVNLQDIEGRIKLDKVNGNLVIKGYSSGVQAEARGNATLRLDPEPGNQYVIKAGGNINCRLSADTNARVVLTSGAKNIRVNALGSKDHLQVGEHEMIIGEGETEIILNSGGIIDFSIPTQEDSDWAFEFDFEKDINTVADDISQIVTEQIELQLESLGEHLSNLSENLASIGPVTSEKTRRKLEAKRKQLERKLARIERKASERAKQAGQRARTTRSRFSYRTTPSDPVSDEERQQVLQMLQDKKITVQEAEILLAALEGRKIENVKSTSSGDQEDNIENNGTD
jgi:hypothetical protein